MKITSFLRILSNSLNFDHIAKMEFGIWFNLSRMLGGRKLCKVCQINRTEVDRLKPRLTAKIIFPDP